MPESAVYPKRSEMAVSTGAASALLPTSCLEYQHARVQTPRGRGRTFGMAIHMQSVAVFLCCETTIHTCTVEYVVVPVRQVKDNRPRTINRP
jgi:hypothetical protein